MFKRLRSSLAIIVLFLTLFHSSLHAGRRESIKNLYDALEKVVKTFTKNLYDPKDTNTIKRTIKLDDSSNNDCFKSEVQNFFKALSENLDFDCLVHPENYNINSLKLIKRTLPFTSGDEALPLNERLEIAHGLFSEARDILNRESTTRDKDEIVLSDFISQPLPIKKIFQNIYFYVAMQHAWYCDKKLHPLQKSLYEHLVKDDKSAYLQGTQDIINYLFDTIKKIDFLKKSSGYLTLLSAQEQIECLIKEPQNVKLLDDNYTVQKLLSCALGNPHHINSSKTPEDNFKSFLMAMLNFSTYEPERFKRNRLTYEAHFPEQTKKWLHHTVTPIMIMDPYDFSYQELNKYSERWSNKAFKDHNEGNIHIKKAGHSHVANSQQTEGLSGEKALEFYNKNKKSLAKINLIASYLAIIAHEFDIKKEPNERYAHWEETEELNDLLSDPKRSSFRPYQTL